MSTRTSGVAASTWTHGEPPRVMVMCDQPLLVDLLALTLNHGVCTVRSVTSPEQVPIVAADWQPHLIILDLALNGSQTVQHIRTSGRAGSSTLVMGLVGQGDLQSKLAAFEAGADDILTVPFAPEELLARVIALTRRSRLASVRLTPVITVGGLHIDIVNRRVRTGGVELRLTASELGLLYLLAANAGRVLTRKQIADTLWGTDRAAEGNVVDQHVRNLRARLHTVGQPEIIARAGSGYLFQPFETLRDGASANAKNGVH